MAELSGGKDTSMWKCGGKVRQADGTAHAKYTLLKNTPSVFKCIYPHWYDAIHILWGLSK